MTTRERKIFDELRDSANFMLAALSNNKVERTDEEADAVGRLEDARDAAMEI